MIAFVRATGGSGGGALWLGGSVLFLAGAGLAGLVLDGFHKWKKNQNSKITVWSAGRPGEMMVGVVHTGERDPAPGGFRFFLECLERVRGGEWLLWTSEFMSPSPSAEGAWPFHFSIPVEAPPSGPSPDGDVVWRLRAQSVHVGHFEGAWPLRVSPNLGPASKLLPVPIPAGVATKNASRRVLTTKEIGDQTRFSLASPFIFPGPNPLVIWGVALTAFFMVMVRMKAPVGIIVGGIFLNLAAALVLVAQWFGREEVWVDPTTVVVRRSLGPIASNRSYPRSSVIGVRVVFAGGPQRFGVRVDRAGELRPLAAFGGFHNHLDAHEVARSLLRCLNRSL